MINSCESRFCFSAHAIFPYLLAYLLLVSSVLANESCDRQPDVMCVAQLPDSDSYLVQLEKPIVLGDYELPAGALVAKQHGLFQVVVRSDWNTPNFRFKNGKAIFELDGTLRAATPASDHFQQGLFFKAGEVLVFNLNGTIEYGQLAYDQAQLDIALSATGGRKQTGKYYDVNIYFHDNGSLKSGYLDVSTNQTIQGLNIQAASEIELHRNGRIQRAQIGEETSIQGYLLGENTEITLHENGVLKSGSLAKDTDIQGMLITKGSGVSFFPSGKVQTVNSANEFTVKGIDICPYEPLDQGTEFYEDGQLKSARLCKEYSFGQQTALRASTVVFTPDGGVLSISQPNHSFLFEYDPSPILVSAPQKTVPIRKPDLTNSTCNPENIDKTKTSKGYSLGANGAYICLENGKLALPE